MILKDLPPAFLCVSASRPRSRHRRQIAMGARLRLRCDGLDVSEYQVRSGMAWVFDRCVKDRSLYPLQGEARQAAIGLWSDSTPVSPREWRAAIRNKNGKTE